MIENEKQYEITKGQAVKFSTQIENLENRLRITKGFSMFDKAMLNGLKSQMHEFNNDLSEYSIEHFNHHWTYEFDECIDPDNYCECRTCRSYD